MRDPRRVEAALLSQVEEMARTLSDARADIAAIDAGDMSRRQIPSATDELDAIVAQTATATDIILNCCEDLDRLGAQTVTTRIYEACGFQDITGQRITKVVATLQAIERKVAHILSVFGEDRTARDEASTPAALTGGPQLPALAMDQSRIDALMASFH